MNSTFSEKIKSLTEDELCLLYGIINYIPPKIISYDISISLIGFLKRKKLDKKLIDAKVHILPQFQELYNNLIKKLK